MPLELQDREVKPEIKIDQDFVQIFETNSLTHVVKSNDMRSSSSSFSKVFSSSFIVTKTNLI
jgi:hypothetical protein